MNTQTKNNTKTKITMKKIMLAAAVLGVFAVSAMAFGGDDAPAAAKTKLTSLYPNATKVKWGKEDANFEASFENAKVEMSCLFDAAGTLLETESEIEISALPKGVTDYLAKNYAGQKIKEAAKIIDAKNVTIFEAEMKEGDILFDDKGNFIKKVVAPKEKKEDDDDEKDEKK